jgi:hypothetical protein
MEDPIDWLIDGMAEMLAENNAPRTPEEASKKTCPFTTDVTAMCGGTQCSHFVPAPLPEKFSDGLPVATSAEKSRMSAEQLAEAEEAEKWAYSGMFVCKKTSMKVSSKPVLIRCDDEWFDGSIGVLKSRIAGAISPQMVTTAKLYALLEVAFEITDQEGRGFLREAFGDCESKYSGH